MPANVLVVLKETKKIIEFDSLKPQRIIQYLQGNFDDDMSNS